MIDLSRITSLTPEMKTLMQDPTNVGLVPVVIVVTAMVGAEVVVFVVDVAIFCC